MRDASVGRVDYHQHKSLVKVLSVYLLFKLKGHTVLEKDWDAPYDICTLESLALRANQNLASIGLKL